MTKNNNDRNGFLRKFLLWAQVLKASNLIAVVSFPYSNTDISLLAFDIK